MSFYTNLREFAILMCLNNQVHEHKYLRNSLNSNYSYSNLTKHIMQIQ